MNFTSTALPLSAKEKKVASVQAEIARERAESLARSGQRLQRALAALRSFDAGAHVAKSRVQLVSEASEACLALLVQREMLGLGAKDAEAMRRDFDIPPEVWNAMGARRGS
ncbi:MAG TPA: DUF6665 family protein [Steroidobacteraceae bacterium]|nr:DUF6665 family protein [Steroidobacteraceae bacterium]